VASVREKRRTQAERSALSEKLILRAATKLIARQGYTKTTLAQIGRAAGYAAGLVSHRFGSKEGLLRNLVERIRTRFYQDQMGEALAGITGLAALLAAVDTYLNELRVREERMRVLYVLMGEALGPVAEIRPVVVKLNRGFRASAEGWLRSGIQDGEIRADVDPKIEAAVFVGMLRGVSMQWLAERGAFDLQAAAESIKHALRSRLAQPTRSG
jgi:AcrR family transcriptional regulator